jgi:hypothetical protein
MARPSQHMGVGMRRLGLLATVLIASAIALVLFWQLGSQPAAQAPSAERSPASSPPTTPSAAASGGLSAPEEPPPGDGAWAAADWELVDAAMPSLDVLFRVDGMIDTGREYVAWGRVPMPGRNQFNDMGAVFISADGRAWQAFPIEHGVNGANASTIQGVAPGPGGYLAFGDVCCDPEAPAIWHSTDLVTWTRLMLEIDGNPRDFHVADLVGTDEGWVAVGGLDGEQGGGIWASDDGVRWESVLRVEDPAGGQTIVDVASSPEGPVAVGTVTDVEGTYDGAVWRSADGHEWERAGADDPALASDETQLISVVPHAGGFYVSGLQQTTEERRTCEAAAMAVPHDLGPPPPATSCFLGSELAWVSEDGERWERIDPAQAPGDRPVEFRLIVAGGPGLVLVGESAGAASPDTTLYASPDGRVWSALDPALPIGNDVAMAMAVRGDEIIVVADTFADDPEQPRWAVWIASVR